MTSWSTWLATLGAAFGLTLNRAERRRLGSRKPPQKKVRELWAICGRGSGKSRISAAICVYIACFLQHHLDPGERGYVLALAGSRDQASWCSRTLKSFIRRSPILKKMVSSMTAHEIKLTNGVVIAVHSNSSD